MKLESSRSIQIIPYRESVQPGILGDQKTAVFIPKAHLKFDGKIDRLSTMKSGDWIFTLDKKKEFVRKYAAFFVGRFCQDRKLVPSTATLVNRIANKYVICRDMTVFTPVLLEFSKRTEEWKDHVLHEV